MLTDSEITGIAWEHGLNRCEFTERQAIHPYTREVIAANNAKALEGLEATAWRYVVNGAHVNFADSVPPDDGYDTGTLQLLYSAETVAALQARIAELEKDAARYQELLLGVSGHNSRSGQTFGLRLPQPVTDNIMQGSVAQHFTAAIDAARSAK